MPMYVSYRSFFSLSSTTSKSLGRRVVFNPAATSNFSVNFGCTFSDLSYHVPNALCKSSIGKIAIQLDWYKKACDLLIKTNLDVMDTLTVDYSYVITNSLNNQRYANKTKFLLFYYPVGLFESNNILPTHVINRMIVRYRFMDKPICFIPSVTNAYSNTNEFAVKVNAEFNKVLFEIIKFVGRDHDVITDQYDNTLDSFVTRTAVKDKPYKIDMTFKVTGTMIAIFSSSLLPNVAQYNSYYSESFSPLS